MKQYYEQFVINNTKKGLRTDFIFLKCKSSELSSCKGIHE